MAILVDHFIVKKDGNEMSKKIKLFASIFSIFLIFLSSVLVYAEDEDCKLKVTGEEVLTARTKYSKVFRKNYGSELTYVSLTPLHYKNKQGEWQDIDTSLEESTGEANDDGEVYGFKSLKNTFETYLPKHSQGWTQLRLGKSRLAFKLLTHEKRFFNKNKDSIQVNDVFQHCDLKMTLKQGMLKEDIILNNTSAPKTFEYLIRIKDLTMTQATDGSIVFSDSNGNAIFMIPKFVMFDSKKASSEDINVDIKKQGNVYRLMVTPNENWLNSPERVYPVTVDPSVIKVDVINPGKRARFSFVFPSSVLASNNSNANYTYNGNSGNVYINRYSDLLFPPYVLPHPIHVKFTAWAAPTSGNWYSFDTQFKVYPWNINANSDADSWRGAEISSMSMSLPATGISYSKEMDLAAKSAVRIEITTADYSTWFSSWSVSCGFTIESQMESMSSKSPSLNLLPPETPGSTVALRWKPAVDDWNQDAWNQAPYSSLQPRTNFCKAGQIVKYKVQYANNSSFTNPQNFTGTISLDSNTNEYTCSVTGLSQTGSIYYFRVCGMDDQGNPTNMSPWNNLSNPSGPRWSNIAVTKCIAALPAGVPEKPSIIEIEPNHQVNEEPNQFYCNSNTPAITWNQNQISQICFFNENNLSYSFFSTAVAANVLTVNPLNEGDYVTYVQTMNSIGKSLWSDGWKVTIDTTPPTISPITETISDGNVKLKFSSAEPVQVYIYWDSSPDPLPNSPTGYKKYDGTDTANGTIELGYLPIDTSIPLYYHLELVDKAQNTYSTGNIQLGITKTLNPAVNITLPTDSSLVKGVMNVQTSVNSYVTSVEFYIDGNKKSTVTSAPFQWNLDTTIYPNGSHSVTAKAYNSYGVMVQNDVTVIFRNPIDIQQVQPLPPINGD
jgi:hypothetical protein